MYKFVITIQLQPGSLQGILERASAVQSLTRAEPGCLCYDFYTCTDDPDRLVFIECFESQQAHAAHCNQVYTKEFIEFHEQFHESFKFELVSTVESQQ